MEIKASVFIATSLDGYIARENGELDWLSGFENDDPTEDYGYQQFMDSIDLLIMGRHTFEKVLTFSQWPYPDKRVWVASSNFPEISEDLKDRVQVVNQEPRKLLEIAEEQGNKHVYIDGGRTIQDFLKTGLIHELIITRLPVLIGSGIPLFGKLNEDVKFDHIETKTFSNGLVQSRYRLK